MTQSSNGSAHLSTTTCDHGVPVIDLQQDNGVVVKQIADACSTFGFFQVVNHGIDLELLADFRRRTEAYFDLSKQVKLQYKRNECNARGFFDDELTKQKIDWKEALDMGVPGSRDWNMEDSDAANACLDGFNQFPSELQEFRPTMIRYFEACAQLSDRLAALMAMGLQEDEEQNHDSMISSLRTNHTSYLRLNYYPPCPDNEQQNPLGISPHKDAGFLTVLAQDEDCHSLQVWLKEEWITVQPVKDALTINTGDMAMIYSNGKYKAPLHRVLTNPTTRRYSAPFFYNPGYNTLVTPMASSNKKYHPCLWGYFRAVRFAGDLTDLGVEIQADDYLMGKESQHHLQQQRFFQNNPSLFEEPFSVEKYRPLLVQEQRENGKQNEK